MDGPKQLSLFTAAVPAQLLTIPEAARVLSIGRSSVYELIAGGRLEVVHIGRSARVPLAALVEFVDGLRVDASPKAVVGPSYPRRRSLAAPRLLLGQPSVPSAPQATLEIRRDP